MNDSPVDCQNVSETEPQRDPPRPYPLRKLFACGNKYEFFKKFPHKNTKTVAKQFVLMYNNNAKAKEDSTVYDLETILPIC